jgi:glycosyltransferase involved in cell wall biosynthesis
MNLVHLTASTFYGGPERQMLGLARALPDDRTTFLSFREGDRCREFLAACKREGFPAHALNRDTPYFRGCIREIADYLNRLQADVLLCHGYKANILGRMAARRVGIPVLAVSRGWTGESFKVRIYESLDRFMLRWMDRVVAVSEAQAERVCKAGVPRTKVCTIANAIDPDRFTDIDPTGRQKLLRMFRSPKTRIVGAAGRLSPEKGFDVLIAAAEAVLRGGDEVGFVIFGEGPCKAALQQQIQQLGLSGSVVLGGFRGDLDRFVPHFDLLALPSYTEGMPNVVLEAFAAGVPVVATSVGGVPEVVEDGVSGYLCPAGDADALADRLDAALSLEDGLREMGLAGRDRVVQDYSFAAQATHYLDLFDDLLSESTPEPTPPVDERAVEAALEQSPEEPQRTSA